MVRDIQSLVAEFNERHGVSVTDQALVLSEETGEVSEAVLAADGKKLFKKQGTTEEIGAEVADVIYTAWSVAEAAGIDDVEERVERVARQNLQREEP